MMGGPLVLVVPNLKRLNLAIEGWRCYLPLEILFLLQHLVQAAAGSNVFCEDSPFCAGGVLLNVLTASFQS